MPLVKYYYSLPGNGMGGSLHIVLEDCNVEDRSVRYCMEYATERSDWQGVLLAMILLQMSRTQRSRLSAEHWR